MKISKVLNIMEKAVEVPSQKCLMDKEHKFKFIILANEKTFLHIIINVKNVKKLWFKKLKEVGRTTLRIKWFVLVLKLQNKTIIVTFIIKMIQ